ncbi:MAG: NAD-dependent epimerase/dehydratase family protein [Planctomycetes bacterium]|nr:NAD-dependent epimerase/dehydratase family protein [Planctomycetota bacterium]
MLVTGGGGFLGRAIVEMLLERDATVRVFSRRSFPDLEARGVTCVSGDLGDAEAVGRAVAGVGAVFHVAALAGAWGKTEVFERTNVLGTQNVIAACQRHEVSKLVFTSSPSVINGTAFEDHEGIDESAPYPETYLADYPRTKALAERAVLAANGESLATVALRPHLIVGPGVPHLLPRILGQARAGKLRIVGDGTNKVAVTHVHNAAMAHLLAYDRLEPGSACAGKAYFISQEEPVELWPWINSILEGLGIPRIEKTISYRAAFRLGATLETLWRWLPLGGEPPMTRFVATQLATSHWFDLSAARRDLGYEPELLPMSQVNARLFAYYLEGEGKALLEG